MTSLVRSFFKITLLPLARMMYRQRVHHADRIPESGGVLLIANHTTYIDSFLVFEASPRPVRFIIVSRFMKVGAIGWFLRLFGAIPIQPGRPRDAIRRSVAALKRGEVVCIFPEGQLTRTGTLLELKKGYQLIARRAGAQVLPLFIDGLWDSIFSNEGGRHFWKWPRRFPCPVRIEFGHPVEADTATPEWARSALLNLSAETFAGRRELDCTLGELAIRGLKQRPGALCFVEHGKRRRELKRGQVLAIASVLADRWKQSLPETEERIGVLLPPGSTPALINLALVFSGKIPVNLPFDAESLDGEFLADRLSELRIRSVVTSKVFAPHLAGFPWRDGEGQFIDMGGELSSVNLVRVLSERILARVEPKAMAVRRLGMAEAGEADEVACGYLPKGSTEPVWLTHRSLAANALQLTAGEFVRRHERLFCELPLTTAGGVAFGFAVPILKGTCCSSRSFAVQEARSLVESVVDEDEVTLLVGGDSLVTQLETLPEPWHPELRNRVRGHYVLPAVESDSTLLNRSFNPVESKTGAPVCLGWASDAIGVVISQGFPDLVAKPGTSLSAQNGLREGSLGRLLPGITAEKAGENRLILSGACFAPEGRFEPPFPLRIDEEGFVFTGSQAGS